MIVGCWGKGGRGRGRGRGNWEGAQGLGGGGGGEGGPTGVQQGARPARHLGPSGPPSIKPVGWPRALKKLKFGPARPGPLTVNGPIGPARTGPRA